MDDLHVDNKLPAMIVEDQGTNATTARLESVSESGPEAGLVNDGKGLLDITGLGHGNDCYVLVYEGEA